MTELEKICDEVLEKSAGATQRPWVAEKYDEDGEVAVYGVRSIVNDDTVIETDAGCYPPKIKDAEYIVTAANNAHKLAEIVKVLSEALEILMTDKHNCGCESGGPFDPEFICGGHRDLIKSEEIAKS